jgi:hypothetical protein
MTKYEHVKSEFDEFIRKTDDNGQIWSIPLDPANSDYQAYLKSLDEAATL